MLLQLQEAIHRASFSPFYQERWRGRGISKRFEDYPFTTKDDLRRASPWGMVAVHPREIVRIHASSGTTGVPTVAAYTHEDIQHWTAVMVRSLCVAGVTPGMRAMILFPYGMSSGGLGAHYGMEDLGMAIPASGLSIEDARKLWELTCPEVLMATPSFAAHIAEKVATNPFKIGIFGGELWSDAMRISLEMRLQLTPVDIYGLSEVMGPGVAVQVPGEEGLLLWEDDFYFEIIDHAGHTLDDGQEGELVITTLKKRGMPLIRYRTGDVTRILPPSPSYPQFRRMAKIRGRLGDRISGLWPSDVEVVLALCEVPIIYQIVRGSNTIFVEAGGVDVIDIETKIFEMFGVKVDVVSLPKDTLPRSVGGKAVRVR